MMHVRQYRPEFFEGFENETKDIDCLEEFFEIPFIKRLIDFKISKFSARVYTKEHVIVNAFYSDGAKYVIAFVTGPDRLKFLEINKIPSEPHLEVE